MQRKEAGEIEVARLERGFVARHAFICLSS
jgi:hypothetical protein